MWCVRPTLGPGTRSTESIKVANHCCWPGFQSVITVSLKNRIHDATPKQVWTPPQGAKP